MSSPPPTEESQALSQNTNDTVRIKADYFTGIKIRPLTYEKHYQADLNLKFKDDGETLDPDTTVDFGDAKFKFGECNNPQATASIGRGYVVLQRPGEGTCVVVWPVTGELEGGRQRTSKEQDDGSVTGRAGTVKWDDVSERRRLSSTGCLAQIDSEQMGTFLSMS
jgi:hypothetical protein